jgi:hypothetical protein
MELRACAALCAEGRCEDGLKCISSRSHPGPRSAARCQLGAGDIAGAEASLSKVAIDPNNPQLRRTSDQVLTARLLSLKGEVEQAMRMLRRTAETARDREWGMVALEAELAIGQLELRTTPKDGRARLKRLEESARTKGFLRVSHLARQAIDGHAAPTYPQ